MSGFFIPGDGGFAGMVPRTAARLLAPGAAQNAVNTELFSGELRPFRDVSAAINTPTKVGTKKTIYRFGQDQATDAQYWWHWLVDVDVVRGPINNDASERTYWTGETEPRVSDTTLGLTGGGTDYPINWRKLGVPKPVNVPTLATNGAGAGDPFDIAVVYTYVSEWGEEGPPSDPSPVLAVKNGDTITIGNMSVGPGAGYMIVSKRIYVGFAGNTAADYQFFAAIALATTPHAAAFQSANLAEVIPSKTWLPPNAGLKGLILVANSYLAAFENNDVWLSEPGLPHAWPARYRKSNPFGVVGLGSFDKTLVVLTKGTPQAGTAPDPASLVLGKVQGADGKACVAKRGIVSMPGGIAYPCADGLATIGPGGWALATEAFFTRKQWQALKPESFSSYRWGNRYVAFYDNGAGTQRGFIFDPADPRAGFIYITPYATAGYNDPLRDELYLQVGNDIKKWDGGAGFLQQTHRSKIFTMDRPINPGFGKVVATGYPVTFRLYADGVLKHTQAVLNGEPFRLPIGYKAREFEVEHEHAADIAIKGTAVVESIQDLRGLIE